MPRYPGGLIRKTGVTPAGPLQFDAAPGMWTLAEASYWQKQGLWPIAGNFLAVEDVFSTYLYTGNGSTQTITNGIDLAGKGGLVWVKARNQAYNNYLFDTARSSGGVEPLLISNTTDAQNVSYDAAAFGSSGFSYSYSNALNVSGATYASWTFRKAPKFFDVVTWTGNGVAGRQIAHSLGVAPGCIIVKRTDIADSWFVYHTGLSTPASRALILNTTQGIQITGVWNDTAPTATNFTVAASDPVNASGGTYVAYLFAHDPTADGIIQCGSYTGNGSATGPVINLGWEPQWVMVKAAGIAQDWFVFDNMRGMPVGSGDASISPNSSSAELSGLNAIDPTATGFNITSSGSSFNSSGVQYIYIAIRRGPMKTPTVGTTVFKPLVRTGTASLTTVTGFGFPVDLLSSLFRPYSEDVWFDRLRGGGQQIKTTSTAAEATQSASIYGFDVMDGYRVDIDNVTNMTNGNTSANGYVNYAFRRAPGFFDVVCYTGTGSAQNIPHALKVTPELVITKTRNGPSGWYSTHSAIGGNTLFLNDTRAAFANSDWGSLTATSFGVVGNTSQNGRTHVAYLFASCPGVSKVGSYTGNGSSQTINCGFSNGARFFLVKRTDSTGDWWVYDSARGIVAAADPALRLNSTAAEVTSADAVDSNSTGIIVNQETTCNINVNGATYIYLAIA